jgi:lipid II:glycine glycyltransferase (peptidoglycan interpeptide bridge formation enzyme)
MLDLIEGTAKQWKIFVEHHTEANIFHHPLWMECLSQSYGYQPFALVAKGVNGQILAGLPVMEINSWVTGKRWVALPFSDHCSPLLQNDKYDLEYFTRELIFKKSAPNISGIEIRHGLCPLEGLLQKKSYYIHFMKLEKTPEKVFKRFRKNFVRCIKKASNFGVIVSRSVELESLMDFYDLHLMTRKRQGVPTQPKTFFLKFWRYLIQNQMGFIMLAHHENKVISAAVFLHYNRNLVYKYGASHPDYLRFCGNHAIFWKAIQWGCKNGYDVMDWGKTEKSNQGLRNFKNGWGTEEKELVYSYTGDLPKEYTVGWKSKIAEHFIRKSPVWVGRSIGAMLYRHAG